MTFAHGLRGALRAGGRNKLQMQITVLGCDLIGQHLDEPRVPRRGGDPQVVPFLGVIKAGPDEGANDDGSENSDEPGVT